MLVSNQQKTSLSLLLTKNAVGRLRDRGRNLGYCWIYRYY